MTTSAELQILISVSAEAKRIVDGLIKDLSSVSKQLKGVGDTRVGVEATSGLRNISSASKDTSKEVVSLNEVMGRLNSTVKLLAGGFLALQSVRFIKGLADEAARAETLGIVLRQVGVNAGFTRTELDNADTSVRKLGITAQSSRQSLTQFIQAGLDISDAPKLARAAQDLAVIAGENSSDTFARLIVNIQQLDTMGLRHMGIIVSMEEAQQKYAISIGKSAGSLSQQEKQQAALNEVLYQSVKLTGTYEAAMGSVGKQLSSLDRYVTDLKTSLGTNLLPAYLALVEELTIFLKDMKLVSEEMDKQGEGAKSLGEAVKSVAKDVREIVTALVKFKDVIIFVGEAWAIAKIATWVTPLLNIAVAASTASGGVGALAVVLRTAVVSLLGVPGAIAVAAFAIYKIIDSIAPLRSFVEGFTILVLAAIDIMASPFQLVQYSIGILVDLLSGNTIDQALDQFKQKWSDVTEEIRSKLDFVAGSFLNIFKGDSSSQDVQAPKVDVAATVAAYDAQIAKVKELGAAYDKAAEAGDEKAKKELSDSYKAAVAEKERISTQIDLLRARKDLNEEEKNLLDTLQKVEAAAGLASKAIDGWNTKIAEARKTLSLDDFVFDNGKVYTSKAKTALSAFTALYSDTWLRIKTGAVKGEDGINLITTALKQLIAEAKNKADLEGIRNVFLEISGAGTLGAAAIDDIGKEIGLKTKQINDQELSRFSGAAQERRALQKSEAEKTNASISASYAIELANLRRHMSALEDTYSEGKASVADYYEAKRAELQLSAQQDTELLQRRLAQNKLEQASAKKDGLKGAEINGLVKEEIELQSQLSVKAVETTTKMEELNRAQEKALQANHVLYLQAKDEYLQLIGDTATARKNALAREIEDKKKALKPGTPDYSDGISTYDEIKRIKEATIDLDQRGLVIGLNKANLEGREADFNRQLELGTLSRFDYDKKMTALTYERVANAEDELAVLQNRLALSREDVGLQTQVANKEREIQDLRQRAKIGYNKLADDITGAFENATSKFFDDLMSGTKTWKEAFLSAISSIAKELGSLAAKDLAKNLYSGGEDGKVGNWITNLFRGQQGPSTSAVGGASAIASLAPQAIPNFSYDPTSKVQDIFSATQTAFSTGSAGVVTQLNTGGLGTSNLFDSLGSAISGIFNGLGEIIGSSGSAGKAGTGIIGFFSSFFSGPSAFAAEGGYLKGPSHAQGGIHLEAEGGEHITNARQTAKWLPLLTLINSGMIDKLVPTVRRPTNFRFEEGGLVPASQAGGSSGYRIINVVDSSMVGDFMSSSAGEKVILNTISRNPAHLRQIIGS